jgi:WD40 repeat protein
MIAEGGGFGNPSIIITNIKTGKSWFLDGHPGIVGGIAFSPDGKLLDIGGSDKNIYIFNVTTKSVFRKFEAGNGPIRSIFWGPDGNSIVSMNEDSGVNVWELPSGKLLVGAKSGSEIWGTKYSGKNSQQNANELSKDGKYFLHLDDRIFSVWETTGWNKLHDYKTPEKYESISGNMIIGYDSVPVCSAVFSKNREELISSHKDGTLRVWNISSGRQLNKISMGEDAQPLAVLDDQSILALVGKSVGRMKIKVFDHKSGAENKKFNFEDLGYAESMVLSPNGKDFATCDSRNALLWNINKSKPVYKFDLGFSLYNSMAFSPDGKLLAAGGDNQNVFLFDVETGEKIWQLIPEYQPGELESRLMERVKK